MVLIFGVLLVTAVASHLVPSGSYTRKVIEGDTRVVPGSYHAVEGNSATLFDVFLAIPRGLLEASQYLFIVFIAGGLFHILASTGALENAVGTLVKTVGLGRRKLLVWLTTFLYGFFGVAVGFENNIALVPIALLVTQAIGGDRLVGVGMAVGGIGIGFALSPINPYTVGVSQQLAELPLFSGALLRTLLVIAALCCLALYLTRAMERGGGATDEEWGDEGLSKSISDYTLSRQDLQVLLIFVGGILYMLYGVFTDDWYINEIAATFVAMAVFTGVLCRMSGSEFVDKMMEGAASVTSGALIIGLAASIQIVLEDAKIIDTIVRSLAGLLAHLPVTLAAVGMSVVQGVLNFFIPSGSGQAMVTMPILIPLGDLAGITRQTLILAFQVGDGLTNLVVPTSGGTLAMLALGRVSYAAWLRFIAPLMAITYGLSWAFIVVAVSIDWS